MPDVKCLIVTTHYKPLVGGAQAVYDALADKAPHNFGVLTGRRDFVARREVASWKSFDEKAKYPITRIESMRPDMLADKPNIVARVGSHLVGRKIRREVMRRVIDSCKAEDYNVVCIGALDALGWLVAPLKEELGIKVILYTHGEEISQTAYNERAERARQQYLTEADGVIAVSSFTASLIEQKYGVKAGRIKCLGNGVNLEKFRARPTENVRVPLGLNAGPLVLSVGRLVPRKGFDQLLRAWPNVLTAVPEAQLAIVGSGPQESELEGIIAELGITKSVHLLGHVADGQLPSLYASADVFAMPNRTMPDGDTEGFGLVFLEAAAAGTPSIAGRAGGAVDAVIDGKTGKLVDGKDTGAIAFAVTELLTDEVQRREMADAARAHALTQGWEEKASELLAYLSGLLEGEADEGRNARD
ncbi:glycosyltransferase family 4 protein [Kordiimonas sp.]|uniref:glycosyltransferase family 4 protein n=1 Tax=Kordiimonas sp. TaxID=1970157 RepID=UPI003A8D27BC